MKNQQRQLQTVLLALLQDDDVFEALGTDFVETLAAPIIEEYQSSATVKHQALAFLKTQMTRPKCNCLDNKSVDYCEVHTKPQQRLLIERYLEAQEYRRKIEALDDNALAALLALNQGSF
jgi:hypothetical protein